jgi:tetratricopeptide (TPR) repeat protein
MNVVRAMTWVLILASFLWMDRAVAQPWVEIERGQQLMADGEYEKAAEVFHQLVQANPADGYSWSQHGYCLHVCKRYKDAMKSYARAIELGQGRAHNLYNTACAHSLLGHTEEAFSWLEKALAARFADQQTLENDSDWDALRSDPRFARLTGITAGLKTPLTDSREQGWAWDLDFLVRRMEQMHWDVYAHMPREDFLQEVESMKRDAEKLDDSQMRVRLRRLIARIGDGHTTSWLFPEGGDRKMLPIHVYAFADGCYVIGAQPKHAALIGARVVKIGELEMDEAMTAVRDYASVDNEMGYLAAGPQLLRIPAILRAIGASSDEDHAELTCVDSDGNQRTARIEPVHFSDNGHGGFLLPGFQYLHDSLPARPLFLTDVGHPLRRVHLPSHRLVYFWFGAVTDGPSQSFEEFCREMFDFIEKNSVEHLVIDMRFNRGGNTGLVRPLIEGLIAQKLVNRRGQLWVLIGRDTFSAAQNTVNLLDKQTHAVFVGEPTGSRPQFVGESTWFVLPHSRTRVYCSSRYWQHMDSTDERVWVPPQIPAPLTFSDYALGRDPGWEAIMAQLPSVNEQGSDTTAALSRRP